MSNSNIADLAPMVAAVLRDKAFDDLLLENANLKAQLATTRRLEITGPEGTPVYATGDLSKGSVAGGGERWLVELEQVEHRACPLEDIADLQVRVGGMSLLKYHWVANSGCQVLDFIIGAFDASDRSGLFEWHLGSSSSSLSSMMVRCGPFDSYEEYCDLDFGRRDYSCANLMTNSIDRPGMTVQFLHVDFELAEMQVYCDRHAIPMNVREDMEEDDDDEEQDGGGESEDINEIAAMESD